MTLNELILELTEIRDRRLAGMGHLPVAVRGQGADVHARVAFVLWDLPAVTLVTADCRHRNTVCNRQGRTTCLECGEGRACDCPNCRIWKDLNGGH